MFREKRPFVIRAERYVQISLHLLLRHVACGTWVIDQRSHRPAGSARRLQRPHLLHRYSGASEERPTLMLHKGHSVLIWCACWHLLEQSVPDTGRRAASSEQPPDKTARPMAATTNKWRRANILRLTTRVSDSRRQRTRDFNHSGLQPITVKTETHSGCDSTLFFGDFFMVSHLRTILRHVNSCRSK